MGRHTAYEHEQGGDGVENTIEADGTVEGEITQVGHLAEDDDEQPRNGRVQNTIIGGTVTGQVIQAGNIAGPLHLG